MFTEKIHFKITFFLLLGAMITSPFTIYFMLPIAFLLFLNFMAQGNWKIRMNRIKENGMTRYFWLFLSIYLLYLLGMTYTQNIWNGWSNLENKLWFLLAPFIVFTMDPERFTWKIRNRLVFVFIIFTTLMALSNMGISLLQYLDTKNPFLFFYEKASHMPTWRPMHPTYLSMYITFSFVASLYYLYFSPIQLKKWKKVVLTSSLPILFIFNYLLQSKAGLIVFLVMLLFSTLYLMNRIKIQILKSILFVLLLGAFVFVTLRYGSETMNRMAEAMRDISRMDQQDDAQWHATESASQRIDVWQIAAKQSVKHFPMGVGTGDASDIMVEQYKILGYQKLYEDRLNPHNQYLQTFLAVGILGLLSIIAYFAIPFFRTVKEKKLLYMAFLCIVMPNLLTESMFETGSGANFIALFMCLLAYDAFVVNDKILGE
jgi:O-antigen ligase